MHTKLTISLLGLIFAASNCFATYEYYLTDPLTSIRTTRWTQNGDLTPTDSGLTTSTDDGGSLISKTAVPDGTSNYEVKTTLRLTASGGRYLIYLRATANAWLATYVTGTFYAFELYNPTFSGTGCTATLKLRKKTSLGLSLLGSQTVPCRDGMEIRAIIRGTTIRALIDGYEYLSRPDSAITSGKPGVGLASATPTGNSMSSVALGVLDTTAPPAPSLTGAATLVLPNRIDAQWPGAADDANGIGIEKYVVNRNDASWITVRSPEFSDQAVTAGQTYDYDIAACDFHGNCSTYSALSVTAAPAGAVDPRRVGLRPDGSYWGGGGEQIDMRSGNLSFSIPLLKAAGRTGWGVGLGLSYNSQLWRQDGTTTWELGRDVGYGFGWKMQVGSLTPYWSGLDMVHHYTYTDSSGAEYILDVNSSGIWKSTASGVYVEYDEAAKRLYFPDGSFWYMGATSSGLEDDAGTMYPTTIEDSNGNTVTLLYRTGYGAVVGNSSARIWKIFDLRSGDDAEPTYTFTWNAGTWGTDPPVIASITNSIGTGERYTFSTGTTTELSPFDSGTFGSKHVLNTISRSDATGDTGLAHHFTYSSSGELESVTLPYGGILEWDYRTFAYSGSRSLREVQNRYLTKAPGASQVTYSLSFDDTAGSTLHAWSVLNNPDGPGRRWTFGATAPVGGLSRFEAGFPTYPSWDPLVRQDFTYSQDSVGRYYISSVLKTTEPAGANKQSKTEQTVDVHGNVTQTKLYGYDSLTTPVRTFTSTYKTNYGAYHIWNRLLTSSVTDGTDSVTLVSNQYDQYSLDPYGDLVAHDEDYDESFESRGNVTQSTTPGAVHQFTYDVTGNVLTATDTHGHSVASTYSGTTQYAAPDKIAPGGNDDLATNYTYTSFLGLSTVSASDTSASMDYDYFGRPSSSVSPYGATTTFTYDPNNVRQVTTTTGTVIVKTTLDGLGRTVKTETGDSSGTKLVVDTEYDYCACSPLGKVKRVSNPYVPNATVYWTSYLYDSLGRTTRVTLPDGSYTTTAYSGNTTTETDPAGHWKTYTTDALGNLVHVSEPAPEGGTHETSYVYNVLNQLTQVTMPRGSDTQTRTFNYDLTTGRLTSVVNPENGTVQFEYNTDGTLLRKTDAKGQKIEFTYDSYLRVATKRTYTNGTTEDLCGKVTYYWDTAPGGVGDQSWHNTAGRLMAVRWSDASCTAGQFTEGYQYSLGLMTTKRLYAPALGVGSYIDGTVSYNNLGQPVTVASPVWHSYGVQWPAAGTSYTYSYDTLKRPTGLTEGQTQWVSGISYGGPSGQMTALSYGGASGYSETLAYNERGQLTELHATGTDLPEVHLKYHFTAGANDGRISQMEDLNPDTPETVNYQYDSLGRLTRAETEDTEQWGQSFSYDGFGNLTAEEATQGTAPTVYHIYNAATNRLLGPEYSYDDNGNLTAMPQLGLTYNVENRLIQADGGANGLEKYGYDPGGLKLWQQGPDGVLHITYNGINSEPAGDFYLQNGAVRGGERKVYFGGFRVDNQTVLDRVGSSVVENGQPMGFYPYGEWRPETSGTEFATYKRSSVAGLDYAQQRWYSSQLGRFMTPDPYQGNSGGTGDPEDPQSWNHYGYVGNDPINRADPAGLCRWGEPPGDLPPGWGRTYCNVMANMLLWGSAWRPTSLLADPPEDKNWGKLNAKLTVGWNKLVDTFTSVLRVECGDDLKLLGVSADDILSHADPSHWRDALGNNDHVWETMTPSDLNYSYYRQSQMLISGLARTDAVAGGVGSPLEGWIYFKFTVRTRSVTSLAALLIHEALHTLIPGVPNQDQDELFMQKLGEKDPDLPSEHLTDRLERDCFGKGKSHLLLGPAMQ